MTRDDGPLRCGHCENIINEDVGVVEVTYTRPVQPGQPNTGFTYVLHFCSDLCLRPYVVMYTEKIWNELQAAKAEKQRLMEEIEEIQKKLEDTIDRIMRGEDDDDADAQ